MTEPTHYTKCHIPFGSIKINRSVSEDGVQLQLDIDMAFTGNNPERLTLTCNDPGVMLAFGKLIVNALDNDVPDSGTYGEIESGDSLSVIAG